MAFEAYLTQDQARPSGKRRLLITASLAAHGALLAAGVVYSFWHVDEVSPPTVTVTFLANAPPPPPPPAAAKKKRSDTKTRVVRELTQPKPTDIVQPKDKEEKKEDDDDGVEGGVEGGVAGGIVGGVVGGTGTAAPPPPPPAPPAKPQFVSPAIGGQQLAINPRVPPYRLVLPPAFAQTTGIRLWAMLQICVNPAGGVTNVSIIKGMDPKVDPLLASKVRTWRYKPMTVDGQPVPFCYRLRYEHQT